MGYKFAVQDHSRDMVTEDDCSYREFVLGEEWGRLRAYLILLHKNYFGPAASAFSLESSGSSASFAYREAAFCLNISRDIAALKSSVRPLDKVIEVIVRPFMPGLSQLFMPLLAPENSIVWREFPEFSCDYDFITDSLWLKARARFALVPSFLEIGEPLISFKE